jgi:hypothetical protein
VRSLREARVPLQERARAWGPDDEYPWRVLVICVLCNRVGGDRALPVARAVCAMGVADVSVAREEYLARLVEPLGLQHNRARRLVALSRAWGDGERDPGDLPGCGRYAREAHAIFVEGRRDFEPEDHALAAWVEATR